MHKTIAEFFSLKGYLVYGLKHIGRHFELEVRVAAGSVRCPHCGIHTERVYDRRSRRVLHTMSDRQPVYLRVRQRRFRCRPCSRVFSERLPGVQRRTRRTETSRRQTLESLVGQSFGAAAIHSGVSPATAWRDLQQTPLRQAVMIPSRGELRLGIDGHSFRGHQMVTTIVELGTHRTIAVLPNTHPATLARYLTSWPTQLQKRIVEVCVDMESGLANTIRQTLPHVRIVIDEFHVIHYAGWVIDQMRQVLRAGGDRIPARPFHYGREHLSDKHFEQLVGAIECYPILGQVWQLKEDLRQLYQLHNKRLASYRLGKIIVGYQGIDSRYAKVFARALTNRRSEILNFFDRRTTNAQVESRHQKFKLIQRQSFGFRNLASYIAKIMLACVPLFLVLHPHLMK